MKPSTIYVCALTIVYVSLVGYLGWHESPAKAPTRHVVTDTSTMYSDNVSASLTACEEAALSIVQDGPSYVFSVNSCVIRLKVSI